MAVNVKVHMNLPKANALIKQMGLGPNGDVQRFHTQNVLRRITKYMPYRTGALIKLTIAQTDVNKPEIVTRAPQAAVAYYGKVMVDSVTGKGPANIPGVGPRFRKGSTLKATDRDLNFSHEKNPHAGPYWDRALVANEGDALVRDLQRYVDRRGRA